MRLGHAAWPLLLALVLAACAKAPTSAPGDGSGMPSAALAPPAATRLPTATAVERQEAGLAPAAANKFPHQNEDGSEMPNDAADAGSRNPMLLAVASTMAAATSAAAAATDTTAPTLWEEGRNYTRLVPAQPTSAGPGQVEVLEFFWYACPHCYSLDPLVQAWRKTKPAYIAFSRVPVMWTPVHRSTARLYYTLESLGKLDQLHADVFKEIHANHDPLIGTNPDDESSTEQVQAAFLKQFGIAPEAFDKASHSFTVETDLQRADQLGMRYRIDGVPTFVVNGKYVADVASAGGPERLLALVGDLAAEEHKN